MGGGGVREGGVGQGAVGKAIQQLIREQAGKREET